MRTCWSPRLRGDDLRMQVCARMADLLIAVLATDLVTDLSPCGLNYSPIWPWFCHQQYLPRDLAVVMPTCALVDRPINLGPGCEC